MQIIDLGNISRPVLLFGGVYGNVQALKAVIALANAQDMQPVCTGDIAAYCADGEACAALMRAEKIATIAGNCERNLAAGVEDCGCGFESGSTCERLSATWFAHAQATISPPNRAWMQGLPDRITFRHAGRRYGVLHGGADDIARFVWPGAAEISAQLAMAESRLGPLDGVIAGHCGLSFRQGRWVNAGAIGMPPNDGRAATRYAVLHNGAVHFEKLDYDPAPARKAMAKAGLTQGYDTCLQSGFWPSEEVLPTRLKRLREGVFVQHQ